MSCFLNVLFFVFFNIIKKEEIRSLEKYQKCSFSSSSLAENRQRFSRKFKQPFDGILKLYSLGILGNTLIHFLAES